MGTSINVFTSLTIFPWRLWNFFLVILWLSPNLLQNVSPENTRYRKRRIFVLKYTCVSLPAVSLWTETNWLL
jgi:hypothetical protein